MRAPTRDDKRQHRFGGGSEREEKRIKVLFKGGEVMLRVKRACMLVKQGDSRVVVGDTCLSRKKELTP